MNTTDADWNRSILDKARQFKANKDRAESAMARLAQFAAQRGVLTAELARVRAEIARRSGTPAGGSSFSSRTRLTPTRSQTGAARVTTPRAMQFTAGLPTLEQAYRMDPSELARLGLLSFHVTG